MLIQLIQDRAEEQFLETLDEHTRKSVNWCVLICAFSRVPLIADADDVLPFLKEILADCNAELYWCRDGDMAVCWRGNPKKIMSAVIAKLSSCYKNKLGATDPKQIFRFFDAHAQGEDLRLLFRGKLKRLPGLPEKTEASGAGTKEELPPPLRWKPGFSDKQLQAFREALIKRTVRKEPELLIVEDQDFSRKLLAGMFERNYRCHSAKDAEQAAQLYAEHAPDITFLDIELPDADGHTLAALFKKYDPESYVVMVTGNNYVKDVETAKANRVQGFIVKPYNKLKIMGAVEAFMNRKKKG